MGKSWKWPFDVAPDVVLYLAAATATLILIGVAMGVWWNQIRRRKQSTIAPASDVVEPAAPSEPAVAAEPARSTFHVLGASVRGTSHERAELVNQDALFVWPSGATAPPLVLAVADGHGSAKCFRSDVGSRLAVETVTACFRELLERSKSADLSLVKRELEETFPQEVERRWKAAVEEHLAQQPLLLKEVVAVGEKQGVKSREAIEARPVSAYGTTLLAVVVHRTFIACVQLGDGDILVVDDAGGVERPIADDPRLFANETTSLSGENAWRDFRVAFQSLADRPPALILLATDGYSNAFRTPEDFLRVGSDLLEMLRSEGVEYVREQLPSWLEQASREGSGDDVTVGLLFHAGAASRSALEADSQAIRHAEMDRLSHADTSNRGQGGEVRSI